MTDRSLRSYRAFSLGLAVIFAAVGALFLATPGQVLGFFNVLSRRWGLAEAPVAPSFFAVLAVAYMVIVTFLAWRMFRSPHERVYPRLLGLAKLASSVVSFLMFAVHAPWLIYLANGIVDGGIGILVLAASARVARAGGGARP